MSALTLRFLMDSSAPRSNPNCVHMPLQPLKMEWKSLAPSPPCTPAKVACAARYCLLALVDRLFTTPPSGPLGADFAGCRSALGDCGRTAKSAGVGSPAPPLPADAHMARFRDSSSVRIFLRRCANSLSCCDNFRCSTCTSGSAPFASTSIAVLTPRSQRALSAPGATSAAAHDCRASSSMFMISSKSADSVTKPDRNTSSRLRSYVYADGDRAHSVAGAFGYFATLHESSDPSWRGTWMGSSAVLGACSGTEGVTERLPLATMRCAARSSVPGSVVAHVRRVAVRG